MIKALLARLKTSRGSVFAEFAIVFPLLIVLVMGIYDFTRAINHYFLLSRLAYEGTRLATSVVGLENASYDEYSAPASSQHKQLQTKIRGLVATYNTRVSGQTMLISTSYNNVTNLVKVDVQESYVPLFLKFFPPMPVAAAVEGPYLLKFTVLPTPTEGSAIATPAPTSTPAPVGR